MNYKGLKRKLRLQGYQAGLAEGSRFNLMKDIFAVLPNDIRKELILQGVCRRKLMKYGMAYEFGFDAGLRAAVAQMENNR